ncbi:MAG: (2Fe-2S)-binding protein, partial [Bdellovibrionales bacterium]|nr:(2Fe-2S)-binding protein [Bdellovibrionales bacterium]
MPKITLNGKSLEVAEGTTIIEAYKQLDEPIAHYCWHPGLSVAGVCCLCVVAVY